MSALRHSDRSATQLPTEEESQMALDSSRKLSQLFAHLATRDHGANVVIKIAGQVEAEEVALPLAAIKLFGRILEEMGQGNVVTLTPIHAELTTQEAADLLNVSRPYLCKLLDEGKVDHRKVGRHRRVKYRDLMDFKRQSDSARSATLEELVAQAQELNMGY